MRSTHNEFVDSEVQNWRDSGQALEDAKRHMSDVSDLSDEKWAQAALKEWRDGLSDKESEAIPYTNEQILAAVEIEEYSSRGGEGRDDPDISIDHSKLTDPSQPTLPGLPEEPPISSAIHDAITDALTKGFNEEAESNAQDADPPSYISDSVSEYQEEYWSSMDDSDKFAWADRNGELPEYPLDDEDQDEEAPPVEASDPQRDALIKLTQSRDPKALWAIADSSQGKSLLLNTNWAGVLDFKDKQTMDRFHAYVGKAK
jgi:hypothetical protein